MQLLGAASKLMMFPCTVQHAPVQKNKTNPARPHKTTLGARV